jgi:hypothetical protein
MLVLFPGSPRPHTQSNKHVRLSAFVIDGILYPSRIDDMSQFGFLEELGKAHQHAEDDEATDD